ncbi:Indole-3-glycerol-phosphate synthase [Saliniradius amylolyticus]|uniref:Multifunctional fusion protein n=1 Tax=Saliniradius amylolyticus TaxID=2183582 RepID=A0A2S2E297_9ALTE|nr:bifunctional indole-3-glycerol-phosphate synthase TrpC/phosphoribosylanthranilate isomerase TrpF [Saliniradius amylolyticus]AWL11719.1 Indole-3-glycerol-phosphate synthase [Saliniradius amylolyticus]
MDNVLARIVADKRQELTARKQALPLSEFQRTLTPSKKSLYRALSAPNTGFILECKKASPSKGLIRERFDLDEILAAYTPYAAGISVLTDEKYFQGRYEYLQYVTERVSQPVLNKDFFVDPYQVYLARYYGADAILLMLSVLSDDEYKQLEAVANELELDILTEVSNEQEAERACQLKAKIIGINNRNLRDLSTDLAATERLAPLLSEEAVVISESGIYTHEDVQRLAPHADGFLVGSALMAQHDLPKAVRQLVLGKVKVCGLTRIEDTKAVAQSGASYGGLIFARKSSRCVTLEQAQAIVDAVPFNYVGVFVNEAIETVADTARQLSLVAVQLHGDEDHTYIDQLRAALPDNCQVWRAVGVKNSLPEMDHPKVDHYLLDCQVGKDKGGTGQSFDWSLLEGLVDKSGYWLAGGLSPENIKQARRTGLGGLDANSGVESAPGIKDADKIKQLFNQLRDY